MNPEISPEDVNENVLTESFKIHFFELPKLSKDIDENDIQQLWLQLLNAETMERFRWGALFFWCVGRSGCERGVNFYPPIELPLQKALQIMSNYGRIESGARPKNDINRTVSRHTYEPMMSEPIAGNRYIGEEMVVMRNFILKLAGVVILAVIFMIVFAIKAK